MWTNVEARNTAYLMRDLRDRIAEHVQRMPLSALERYHSGDLVIRLMDHIPWIADYLLFVAQFVYQPLILFASIAFIASINWKMLLVFLTITPLSAPLYARLSRPVQDLSKRLTADQASALPSSRLSASRARSPRGTGGWPPACSGPGCKCRSSAPTCCWSGRCSGTSRC